MIYVDLANSAILGPKVLTMRFLAILGTEEMIILNRTLKILSYKLDLANFMDILSIFVVESTITGIKPYHIGYSYP